MTPIKNKHDGLAQSSVLSTQHPVSTQPSSAGAGALLSDLCTDLLGRGHDVRFRAPGRSMYPAIREGETITVRPVSPLSVKKGDIILYRWQQGVIAHRVVGIENTGSGDLCFVLRGDASGARAERVAPAQVLGRVIAANRDGRRIDLYSIPSTVRRVLRPLASRFKQWVLRRSTHRP